MDRCLICGTEFVEGKCPNVHELKPMCLNCISISESEGEYRCLNEAVLDIAREKMMAALPEGYEVDGISIKPMLLKNPCKKCKNYEMNKNRVIRAVLNSVGLGIEDYVEEC